MRIEELPKRTGACIRSLRYYDNMGLLGAKRMENGYREFDESAVQRVQEIRSLLHVGFTVKEIRQIAHCLGDPAHSSGLCQVARAMYQDKLDEINDRIQKLRHIELRVAEKIASEGTAGRPLDLGVPRPRFVPRGARRVGVRPAHSRHGQGLGFPPAPGGLLVTAYAAVYTLPLSLWRAHRRVGPETSSVGL